MKINGYDYNDHDRRLPSSKSQSKRTWIFIIVFFVGVGTFRVIYKHNMQAKIKEAEEIIEAERVIDDLRDPDYWYQDVYFTSREEIKEYIITMAENPPESGIFFKVSKEFSENDIKDIVKEELERFDGYTKTYYFSDSHVQTGDGSEIESDYMDVNIDYRISDEKYVYDSIVNSKPLPEDRPELEEVKKVCESFHQEYIKDGMSDYEIEVAAHDYIVNNCKYAIDDMDGEYVHSSYGALVEHEAVCDGYSRAMALLLKLEGIEVKLVSGKAVDGTNTAEISEDGLSFIFENEGVSGYSVGGENVGDYSFVTLEIMRFE